MDRAGTLTWQEWVCNCLCCGGAAAAACQQSLQIDASTALPTNWDGLVAGQSLFLSRSYREALDAALPSNIQPLYLVAHVDARPAAAVAAHILTVTDEILALRPRTGFQEAQRPSHRDRIGRWLRNQGLGLLGRRVLVVGNLFSCGPHGACAAPGLAGDAPWQLLPEILRAAEAAAGRFSFVVLKDFEPGERTLAAHLARSSYFRFHVEPSMDLALRPEWRSHADYLAALNTKYRKAALGVLEAVEVSGCTVEPVLDLRPEAERLHALYLQVEARAQIRFGTLSSDYLPELSETLGPEAFRCTVIRRGGEVIGFSTAIKDGDTAIAHVVGFDYAANAELPVYLRLLHVLIDDAIALGCTRVHYGRTALEPKARLGAEPIATEIWTRHMNPIVNQLVGPLLRLAPQDRAPVRKPFKSEIPTDLSRR